MSLSAAMKVIGNTNSQEAGRWLNNREEFTPFVSTKGTGHAAAPQHAKFANVCLRPRLCLQSFQPGTPPTFALQFHIQPHRCSR